MKKKHEKSIKNSLKNLIQKFENFPKNPSLDFHSINFLQINSHNIFYLFFSQKYFLIWNFVISLNKTSIMLFTQNHDQINPRMAHEWFVEHQHGDIIINIKTLRSFGCFTLSKRFILLDTKCERVSRRELDEDEHMILILLYFLWTSCYQMWD